MWQRFVLGALLAIAAYFVIKHFSKDGFVNLDSITGMKAVAPIIYEPEVRQDMNVASGGPNSPNMAPPPEMPVKMSPPPEASDPYDETNEPSNAPESMRNPERSFGPGIVPEQNAIASASGIAGPVSNSPQAFQHFGPELVSNGGNFFGTVSALEDENPNYSSF